MKHLITIFLIVICSSVKTQTKDSLEAKFNGDCLISGGSITVNDYNKLKHLCPPKLTKVIRYKMSYQPKGTHRKNAYPVYFESNELDFKTVHKSIKAGDIVIFEDIVGLGPDKKKANTGGIVLLIK